MRDSAIAVRPMAWGFLLLATAGCAVTPTPPPVATSPATGIGTILAIRQIAVPAASKGAAWRAALLDGAADGNGAAPAAAASLAEFIVREDTGATLSIVQSNADGHNPGDRITVIRPLASPGRARIGPLL